MAIVLYCRPFTCQIMAIDVAPEHVPTLFERMTRNAFCPRTLWQTRPDLFRVASPDELSLAGPVAWHVHAWMVL